MSPPQVDHARWSDLDRTEDPAAYIRLLDLSRAPMMGYLLKNPAEAYAWLEPRPGLRILDVGAGTGSLLHPLADLIGPGGSIVGIDYSQTMVDEAVRRLEGSDLPIEFEQMDACNLEFDDASFDRAISNIVFQHLPDPERALAEMVRVTKPGGLVSIFEQDWETFIVDSPNRDLTRRLTLGFTDLIRNGRIGRELFGMFKRSGLEEVSVAPVNLVFTPEMFLIFVASLQAYLASAVQKGIATTNEVDDWLAELNARALDGSFFAAFTCYRAIGRKEA